MGSIESDETVVGGIDGAPHLFASSSTKSGQTRLFDDTGPRAYHADNDGCAGSRNRRPCAQLRQHLRSGEFDAATLEVKKLS